MTGVAQGEWVSARNYDGARWVVAGTVIGCAGLAGLTVGLWLDRRQALFAYLVAYSYVSTIALGALMFVMIVNTMGATWPLSVRRLAEAITACLPLLAILLVPVTFSLGDLYPWVDPARTKPSLQHLLLHRRSYLNVPFFVIRTQLCLISWNTLAWLLRRWSLAQDQSPDRSEESIRQSRFVSAALLPLVGLTTTIAAIDWQMSLSPDWYSSMIGMSYFAGSFLAALALISVLAVRCRRANFIPLSEAHCSALGRCLLAFAVFWAYLAFFQFLLSWIANKPVEARYYLARTSGQYRWLSWLLFMGQFVAPLLALLSYRAKRSHQVIFAVGLLLLAMHYLDLHWMIMPHAERSGAQFRWVDLAALLTVCGFCIAFGAYRASGYALMPVGDPRLSRALGYRSP